MGKGMARKICSKSSTYSTRSIALRLKPWYTSFSHDAGFSAGDRKSTAVWLKKQKLQAHWLN
jgi:hypothetical protein